MTDTILTLNAGSSSVKFALFSTHADPAPQFRGQVEGIGSSPRIKVKAPDGTVLDNRPLSAPHVSDPSAALGVVLQEVETRAPGSRIVAVGHRVVHGGVAFDAPVLVDDETIAELKALTPFAPLHQPHNLAGIHAARNAFPSAPQVACFDTAFHRSHPFVNDTFALPRALYDRGVRRFGFHGLSYEYICARMREVAPFHYDGGVVVAHLGNGASMCAIRGGQSVGSTMGFSALDGLPMGTRCGQLDPGVVLYLMSQLEMDAPTIERMLYKESGLLGLSGLSSDMRVLLESNDPMAKEAIDYFVVRIRREIGAMAAILGGLDGVVFTGGIGENATYIRERICDDMDWLGLELDERRNRENREVISSSRSRVRLFVIPTNEELMIARHTLGLTAQASGVA